jgi:hypothetical protein
METRYAEDIGEEIILKLEELNILLNKIFQEKNEKKLQTPSEDRKRDNRDAKESG